MFDFPRAILGELIIHQKGFAFKSKDYQEAGIPVVRVSNFTDDSIDTSDLKFVSKEVAQENQKVALNTNDVIIATVGSWPKNPASIVGKSICVPSEMNGALMNQNSVILRVKGACEVDQKYLFIALKTKLFSEYLVSTAQGSANQASVTLSDIFSYEVEWPEPAIRKSIVSMIDSVNQKIILNRQTNQTLEQIAQTIFKSWFVDFEPTRAKIAAKQIGQARHDSERSTALRGALLADGRWPEAVAAAIAEGDPERAAMAAISGKSLDEIDQLSPEQQEQLRTTAALFPDALVDSELGEIPEGWALSRLGDVTTELRRGISPKYTEANGIQVINQKCIRNHSINFELTRLNDPQKRKVVGRKVELGDVLVNSTGVGTLGRLAPVRFLPEPTVFDSHVTVVRADKSKISKSFLCGLMLEKETFIETSGAGSTGQTELRKQVLEDIKFAMPPIDLGIIFEGIVEPMNKKIATLEVQQKSLSETRNTLLPKLLSGELTTSSDQTDLDHTA